MSEKWMGAWQAEMVKMFNGGGYPLVGYISHAAVRAIGASSMELSWYPNIHTRFHEMKIILPKNQFLACVGSYEYDTKPHIFVKGKWLSHIHLRAHSVFALIDAIGVKAAIAAGTLSRRALVRLRKRIDTIASRYPHISFISFADSLLLKSNWRVGQYNSLVKYNYEPEILFKVIAAIRKAYIEVLGMSVYAVLTQGSNEYYDDAVLHTSNNHVSLNSLGLPFAQLLSIDNAARSAIQDQHHGKFDLYMDEDFFHSLNFNYDFANNKSKLPKAGYKPPMGVSPGFYYHLNFADVVENLKLRKRKL